MQEVELYALACGSDAEFPSYPVAVSVAVCVDLGDCVGDVFVADEFCVGCLDFYFFCLFCSLTYLVIDVDTGLWFGGYTVL